ncbi:PilZ domain-containing protein [Sphingobium sp. Z007]|nr:PilZ domain-containing protein [Sphingobium sp. Z007]
MDAHVHLGEPLSARQLVRIRDLSEGGARVQGRSPGVGAHITIMRGETEIPARVVWTTGQHFGVAFDEQVDVDAVLKAASPKAPDRPVYAQALTTGLAPVTSQARRAMPRTLPPTTRSTFGLRMASTGR